MDIGYRSYCQRLRDSNRIADYNRSERNITPFVRPTAIALKTLLRCDGSDPVRPRGVQGQVMAITAQMFTIRSGASSRVREEAFRRPSRL